MLIRWRLPQARSTRRVILVGILCIILTLLVMACAESVTSPAALPTLKPGEPCPVSPKTDFRPDKAPLAGEFPIWTSVGDQLPWSDLPESQFAPPPYRILKAIWVVDKRTPDGVLRLTGRQLDGDGRVLFNQSDNQALQLWELPSAHEGPALSPPGFQDHYFGVHYPGPGCYGITSTIGEGIVIQTVVQILGQ